MEHTVGVLGGPSGLSPALVKPGEDHLHFGGQQSVVVFKANFELLQHSLARLVLEVTRASDELVVIQPHELST